MNNLLKLGFICALLPMFLQSQSGTGWGLRGGINYGSSGDIFNSITESVQNPDENLGWHLGFYGKIGNRLYLRPELVYTSLNSDYSNNKFKMQKLDLPVLAGFNIIGPLHLFIGPAFQYILNTDLEEFSLTDVENDFTIGFNVGLGINLGRLGIDLRYERGFSENNAGIIDSNFIDDLVGDILIGRIDTRPQQLIISVSYNLY